MSKARGEDDLVSGLLSGERGGTGAALLRAALRCAEPFYAGAMRARNWLYDRGIFRSERIDVPVVSVGNITAGGTGKTPMVRWLAMRLRDSGMRPAVLLRGYQRAGARGSDEQALLREYLCGSDGGMVVHAEPDRVAGGREIMRVHPDVNVIILDDGFQHRRLRRDFDVVLIDACNPLGFGHVHPRGLLREPPRGLARADAMVVTRSDRVSAERVAEIEQMLRRYNHVAPVYRARHVLRGLRSAGAATSEAPDMSLETLEGRRFFAMAGIGNPGSLDGQLREIPGEYRGHVWFGDHHEYREEDVRRVRGIAREAGADVLVTTEKDWMKLRRLAEAAEGGMPIWRLEVEIGLDEAAEEGLLGLMLARIERGSERKSRR